MSTQAPADKEHIFPATHLTKLAIRWKECHAEGREDEAQELLDEIIRGSEPMFRRFAQHEGFDRTVELDRLVSVAQEKVVRWLLGWKPKQGRLFSWFNSCAKNAFRSEVNRESVFRRRYHVTSDNLEKFFGAENHGVEIAEAERETRKRMREICSRWGSPQEIGAIKFLLECVTDPHHIKAGAIRACAYAYGLPLDLAKFFYSWCLMELRSQFYDQIRVPFTEQDLFRHANTYTHLVDLLNIVSFDQLKKIVAVMGGVRLRIPTLAQMAKLSESYEVWKEIEAGDKDPGSVEEVARKRRRSTRSAQEIYDEMCETLHEDRSGEYPVYEDAAEASSFSE